MIHQYLDKKQISKRKKIIKNIIGFSLFFVLSAFGILSLTGGPLNIVGRPIWKTENVINKGLNNLGYLFHTKATLFNENKNLIEENLNIKLIMSDYQILKSENAELKEILGRIPEENNFILGNIITKPNHSPYDTFIIDIGKDNEIKEGNVVYAVGNLPIGNISKVYDKTSLVSLYTNPKQKTEGFIIETNVSVELVGRGGGNFEMIIPIDLQVEKGTIIYIPGSTSQVVAVVDDIISSPSDPFKKVILHSPINIQNLKFVEVKK